MVGGLLVGGVRSCENRGVPDGALLERISVDPLVRGCKPCVRGHRIWVSLPLDLLADGMTVEEVLAEYPQLEEADVRAALACQPEALDGADAWPGG